jgi:hypothetical protein
MAISRVPGFSLLANLDRQGTDLSLTSSGQTLQYWDVTNYRIGINNSAPQQALDVSGNIMTSNGHVLTNANLSYDIGSTTTWWRTVHAETINSNNLTGTLLTNAQPNITSIGTLGNLSISGNLTAPYFYGNLLGNVTGIILTNAQPYINSLGALSDLTVSGNVTAPTFNGNVYGNVTGIILTNTQPYIDTLGTLTNLNVTGNILANNITSSTITGTLLTNAQPNITSLGTLANLSVAGNLSVDGNLIVGGVTVGNLSANNITADIFGNITGYVLQGDQPFITNLANITVNTITILSGNLVIGGNVNFDDVYAGNLYQGGNRALDTSSNLQINGDVVGYGFYNSINLALTTTGVAAGVYGDDGIFPQISVDSKGRIISAANISLSKVANLNFVGTTISSNTDLTISTVSGNIYLDAGSTGIVQIVGSDAIGLPAGDNSTRPLYPVTGYTRFNTQRESIEYYDGTQWLAPGEAIISSQVVNPDGVANAFVLSSNTSTAGVLVSINGTLQQPITSYDIVGNNQIIFTETPLTTDIIEIRYISVGAVTVGSLTFGSTTAVSLDIANVNVTGNLLPSANVTYDLGSSTLRWRTGYFSANTIDIGGGTIGLHDTLGFTFTTPGSTPQYMMPNGASTSNTFTSSTVTIQGNLAVDGNISAVGNVSGEYILGSAQFLTGLPVGYSNVNLSAYLGGSFSVGTITAGTWNGGTIGVAYGGTGGTTPTEALTSLLPSGASTGYVLTTGGSGSYYWASAGGGGGATVGQTINTLRQSNTATQGQTVFTLTGNITYTPGSGQLGVYINGVRQFPSEYVETSSNVFTLTTGIDAGDVVFAEINKSQSFDNYANLTYASNIGNISAAGLTVQSAIESLETNKAPLSNPVFTGVTTIGGNLVVRGNLFVNGNLTTINANNLIISDSMIYLADDNPADTLDIGIVSAFTDAVRYQHTGFVRDATDGTWKLFANVVPEPTSTIDFTNATYANLRLGNLTAIDGSFTGNITAVTPTGGDNSTKIATTAYVQTAGYNSQGVKTLSTSTPSGGANGDIWYQY